MSESKNQANMKVTLILYAACFVLLAVCASARSSKHHHSSEEKEENDNVDLTIVSAAGDLFAAIFSPSTFWGARDRRVAWRRQLCVNIYNNQYLRLVFGSGQEIRESNKISQLSIWRYLRKNDKKQLQQLFVQNIEQCGTLEGSEDRIDCYGEVINGVFNEIDRRAINKHSKRSVRRQLLELSNNLYSASIKLEKCLSIVPNETTKVPPKGSVATEATKTTTTEGLTSTTASTASSSDSPTKPPSSTTESNADESTTEEPTEQDTTASEPSQQETSPGEPPITEASPVGPNAAESTTDDSSVIAISTNQPSETEISGAETSSPEASSNEPESSTTVTDGSELSTVEASAPETTTLQDIITVTSSVESVESDTTESEI